MITAVHHRGPDGYGYFHNDLIGLAHARLSIIDLSGGDQPIHNENGTLQVIFNGEIYNYIEERRELEKHGHRFYTESDTEVIVHLYEEYGLDFVHHLNGQFAIALWDQKHRRLILTRDRVGIRPLFHMQHDGRLLFASEIKSLLALPDIPRRIDLRGLQQVFTFWTTLPPDSLFEGVEILPPGCMMVVDQGRSPEVHSYWDWRFPTQGIDQQRSVESWAEALRELMIDAVRLRLRADVPVGAYLSGGLDSSVITSLIKNYTDSPLRSFSIGFEDREFDESEYQRELVDFLGTHHTHVQCTRREIGEAFPRAVWHAESSLVRTAPTPLMLLSEAVRRNGYKVVLTGEGADEVFVGYDLFKEAKIRRFWSHQPNSKWRPRILQRLYPYLKHSPTASGAFTKRFFSQGLHDRDKVYFSHVPRWTTTQRIMHFLTEEARQAAGMPVSMSDVERLLPSDAKQWLPLNQDQYVMAKTLLPGYLLSSQGDRVAMANSIEGRFPFLDHRVIELAASIPPKYKLHGLDEKHVLKRSMRGLIPERIRRRSKQPYRAPDSQSFFADGQALDFVDDLLSEERLKAAGYFDPYATQLLVNKCRKGRAVGFADNMAFVGILSTMLLDELFIRQHTTTEATNRKAPRSAVTESSRPLPVE